MQRWGKAQLVLSLQTYRFSAPFPSVQQWAVVRTAPISVFMRKFCAQQQTLGINGFMTSSQTCMIVFTLIIDLYAV